MSSKNFLILNSLIAITMAATVGVGYYYNFGNLRALTPGVFVRAQEVDKTPPVLSEVKISEIGASSTVISWKTDKNSDAIVNYSLDKNYGLERMPLFDSKDHLIKVNDLKPNMTYYFRVISSDEKGNQAISGDYSFTTLKINESTPETQTENQPASSTSQNDNKGNGAGPEQDTGKGKGSEDTKGEEASAKITKEILDMLEQVNPEDLIKVNEAIDNIAAGEINPPSVLGASPAVETGPDWATIKWVTDKKANSIVAYASAKNYRPDADNPYEMKVGESEEYIFEHEIKITSLYPATEYHYQVLSRPEVGPEGKSKDYTFKTKTVLPEISNLRVSKIEEDAVTVTLSSNIPTKAIVEYTNLTKKITKLAGSSNPVTIHNIRITDLTIDTTYSAIVHVENEAGEKVDSSPFSFKTVKDVLAPTISKITTDSTLYPGEDNKVQTIVSWETDEPSICQFNYQEGVVTTGSSTLMDKEPNPTTKHVQVITSFSQNSVYKYWIKCWDRSLNEAKSDDYTILTPAQEKSIIDMIIGNFESTFGWLKKK